MSGCVTLKKLGLAILVLGVCVSPLPAGTCSINVPGPGSTRTAVQGFAANGTVRWDATIALDQPTFVKVRIARWDVAGVAQPAQGQTHTYTQDQWIVYKTENATVNAAAAYGNIRISPWDKNVAAPAGGWPTNSTSNPAWRYCVLVCWDDETVVPITPRCWFTDGHIVTP
jgi:hypothetical protein